MEKVKNYHFPLSLNCVTFNYKHLKQCVTRKFKHATQMPTTKVGNAHEVCASCSEA